MQVLAQSHANSLSARSNSLLADQSTDDMTDVDEEEEDERSSCPTSQHTLEQKRCQRSASPPTPRRAGPIHDYDYYADSNEDVDISAWL